VDDHSVVVAVPFADHTFVPLPSDPKVPLTREQLDYLFAGEHRLDALRELARLVRRNGSAADDHR
jgi:hypothetical protein